MDQATNTDPSPFRISTGSYVLSVIMIFNFITPTAVVPRSVPIIMLSLIPVLIILGNNLLEKNSRFEKRSFLFLLTLAALALFTANIQNLLNLYFLFLFQLLASKYPEGITPDRNNRILLFIGAASLTLQILYYSQIDVTESGRTGLGTDPNFSGLLILLFVFYLQKENRKLAFIPLIPAIWFFQSRTLLLSILIFFALEMLSKTAFNKLLFKILHPFLVIVVAHVAVILLSAVMLASFTFQNNTTSGISNRLVNMTDQSNSGRLTANVYWATKVLKGEYLVKSENIEEKNFNTKLVIMPHNSLLNLLISSTTLFGLIYLLYVSHLLKPLLKPSNISYFYSFLFYSLFLHGLFNSIYLFPFLMVFLLKPSVQAQPQPIETS
jgi:hypothetical protein